MPPTRNSPTGIVPMTSTYTGQLRKLHWLIQVRLFTTHLPQLFPSHLQVGEFWPRIQSLSHSLHSRQHTQNSIQHKNGWAQNAERSSTLARQICHATCLPACPSGTSAAPQTFLHTLPSYSHSNRLPLHSISQPSSFSFAISSKYRVATSKHHLAT